MSSTMYWKEPDYGTKPMVILSYKGNAANVTDRLKRNWELGYNPVAVFGYRWDTIGQMTAACYQSVLKGK